MNWDLALLERYKPATVSEAMCMVSLFLHVCIVSQGQKEPVTQQLVEHFCRYTPEPAGMLSLGLYREAFEEMRRTIEGG